MTFDVDPDVRLFTRLSFGRGWRQSPNALLWLGGIVALASGRIISLSPRSVPYGNPNLRAAALLGLMLAPSRPIARLIDLEYRGLLDQLRLSSRSPSRLLTAALVGSMWPLLALVVAIYVVNGVWFHGQLATVGFGVIAFVVLLDLGFIVFAISPSRVRSGWVMTSAMGFLAAWLFGSITSLEALGWLAPESFDRRILAIAAVALAMLPLATWMTLRRLRQPPANDDRLRIPTPADAVERLVRRFPRVGPPELTRRLRSAIVTVGTPVLGVQLAVLAIASAVRHYRPVSVGFEAILSALPYAGLPIVAVATSMTVRQEIDSRTIEFVRLTPQRPDAVALEWYAGVALPFWALTLLSVLLLRITMPGLSFSWWLPAMAVLVPAVALAEGFNGRLPGTYLALFLLIAGFVVYPYVGMRPMRGPLPLPWGLSLDALVPIVAIVCALGAACGRAARPEGPALAGGAAAAVIAAVALLLREVPLNAYPRLVVGILPLFAVFAAEEQTTPSRPWMRVAGAGGAAAVAVTALMIEGGFPIDAALTTALCAAMTTAIALLGHELWHRSAAMAILAPVVVLACVVRWSPEPRYFARVSLLPSVVPNGADAAVLLLTLGVLTAAHVFVRRQRHRPLGQT